jgi:hypothetical protein
MDTASKEQENNQQHMEKKRSSVMQAPQPHGLINRQEGGEAEFGEDGDEGEEEDEAGEDYYGSGPNTERDDGNVFN